LLAIADRLENVGGAIIHLIPMPDVQGPFSDDFNEDGSFDWPGHIINALGEGDGDNEYAFHDEEFCDGPEDLIEEISAVVEAVKFYRQQAEDRQADFTEVNGANDDLMRRLEQMTRWRNGQAKAAENAENRAEGFKGLAAAALEREKAARDDIIVHKMEAAYLRAGLERLLESSLSSVPLTITQRRRVQSVLDHTWTPA
jgi:hypothetical protein